MSFSLKSSKTEVPHKMLLLRDSSKLLTLYKSLARSIPESLKVYGSVYHINHGNPFNWEVLVDSWPEYRTVVVRPQKQVGAQTWTGGPVSSKGPEEPTQFRHTMLLV